MNENFLRIMYQQWCQDNETYITDWHIFVDMVAEYLNTEPLAIISELKKYNWFYWESKK